MVAPLTVEALRQGGAPDKLDPYLRVARATGGRGLLGAGGSPVTWPVAVEWADPAGAAPLVPGFRPRPGPVEGAFQTGDADASALDALLADARVKRVLLAAAMQPARARPPLGAQAQRDAAADPSADDAPRSDTLLGVIDNGCPFAHPELLRDDGVPRVLRLWNQQPSDLAARAPQGFGYGDEWSRADLQRAMAACRSATGRVDAAAAYRGLGLGSLQRRHSHGAHVLGLLAGRHQWRAGGRSGRGGGLPRRGQASAAADLAFVQLPQHLVDAVSVANLELHALDGLRWLVQLALDKGYPRLGLVFAYESWVGPHDGAGWFENAVDAVILRARAQGLDVAFFTIAGNARARAAHAVLEGSPAAVQWQVPPGNEQACWLELWPPLDAWQQAPRLQLTTPGGEATGWLDWGGSWRLSRGGRTMATLVTVDHSALSPGRPVALLRIEPTAGLRGGAAAEHGIWSLVLEAAAGAKPLPRIDARLGRLEADPQAPLRARSARFVGRSPAQMIDDALGTLNGHAFGSTMEVVGAYQSRRFPYPLEPGLDARGRPHPLYTGAAAHPPLHDSAAGYSGAASRPRAAFKPRWSVDVDDGLLLAGALGPGNAAAAVTRLSGTSAAAPLAAARWADRQLPQASGGNPNPALGNRLRR